MKNGYCPSSISEPSRHSLRVSPGGYTTEEGIFAAGLTRLDRTSFHDKSRPNSWARTMADLSTHKLSIEIHSVEEIMKVGTMKLLLRLSIAMPILFSSSLGVSAQPTSGSIEGRVFDADTRSPLIGAHVVILGTSSGAATDDRGEYVIKNVSVGSYNLKVSYIGYAPSIITEVIVKPARAARVDVGLRISAFQTHEVKVTPQFYPGSGENPTSAVTFSYEEIRRAPGAAGDVSRIMMNLPSVGEVNDQSNGLIVRGGSPIENAFFVDNIEIPNINHFPTQGTTSGPIGLINVDLIREVSFYSGGFSAEYGDRLSSVMDIKFREGNRKNFLGQVNLDFAGFGGVAEGPLFSDRGSWLISVRRSYLDLLIKTIDMGTSVAPRYGDYQWKAVYDLDGSNSLELLGIFGDDHNNPDSKAAVENDMVYYGNQDHYQTTNGLNWRVLWGNTGYSNTSLSLTTESFNEQSYETGSGHLLENNRSLEETLSLRNVDHLRLDTANVAEFGIELKDVIGNYNVVYGSYTDALGNSSPGSTLNTDLRAGKAGVFVSLLSHLTPFLSSTVGLRADYFSYNRNIDLSPRASLTMKLGGTSSVTASAGVYYQSLPLILLAQNPGNRNLGDLNAIHYIAGFERLLTESTKLSIDVYQKEYSNFPVDPQQPSLFLIDELYYRYGFFFDHGDLTGNGRARSRGIELILQKRMAKDFYGMISASYSSSQYLGGGAAWINRVYDNRVIFCVDGGYKPNSEWEFSARWIYAGGIPYTPFDVAASRSLDRGVLDAGKINAERLPPYHCLNVRFDKRFNFTGSDVVCYLSVWNVYDRKNVAQYFWNQVKNDQGTIYQWGILPVFGIEYEF